MIDGILMTVFQQNNLCNLLHNDKDIFFCKFEHVLEDFHRIARLDHEVTMICGNSDYAFTSQLLDYAPNNVTKIFATNSTCSDNSRVYSLPIGIESTFPAKRAGHGQGFAFAEDKQKLLLPKDNPSVNLIYSNFNIYTNHNIRAPLKEAVKKAKHVTSDSSVLSFQDFYDRMSTHEAVLCPIGNGLDTVRTYETFYCGKIPIVYGSDIIYRQLFHDMPCVYAESIEEILDADMMQRKIDAAKANRKNVHKAYLEYWLHRITQK